MTVPSQKSSTLSAVTMRLLLRKRMLCCIMIGCCLAVLAWLTFEQGRTPEEESQEARWLHAKILPDLTEEDDHEGVLVRQEGDEEMGDAGRRGGDVGVAERGGVGNLTAVAAKESNLTNSQSYKKGLASENGKGDKEKKKKKKKKEEKDLKKVSPPDIENLGMTKEEALDWLVERIKQGYCNPPDRHITGDEGKFKPGLELKSVYVVARHGDRTPMNEFSNIPNATWDPQWSCDLKLAARKSGSDMLAEFVNRMEAELRRRSGNMDGVSRYFHKLPLGTGSRCQKSQLTPTGWLQLMKLGGFLRAAYGTTLVSNPQELRNISVFKSTANARTQQSAFSFMHGFLEGVSLRDTSAIQMSPGINFCPLDMCACPAMNHLVKEKEQRLSGLLRNNTDFMAVMGSVAHTLYGQQKASLLPGLSGVAEVLAALLCHSMLYPCGAAGCLRPLQHALYTRYLENTWLAESRKEGGVCEKLGRMSVHPLLTDMAKHWYKVSQGGRAGRRFIFHSGHDITLRPIIDALQLTGPAWPPYASRITFELWRGPLGQGRGREHFVRVLAYGRDQTQQVPFCQDRLNEDGLCPFSALLKFVETDNMEYFDADSFQEACARTHWSSL